MKSVSVLFIVLLYSVSVFSQTNYDDYSFNDKQSVFYDDFSSNKNSWFEKTDGDRRYKIEYGNYVVQSKIDRPKVVSNYIEMDYSKDFEIEVRMMIVSTPVKGRAHFFSWAKSSNAELEFGLTQTGKYKINKYNYKASSGNERTTYVDFTPSFYINKSGYNKITIRKVNNYYYFFINESFVNSLAYKENFGKKVAFTAGGNSTIKIDYLRVSYLGKEASDPVANYYHFSASQKTPVFVENFVDNRNGWLLLDNSKELIKIDNGYYTYISRDGNSKANYLPVSINEYKDWEIELKVKYVTGENNNSNGLRFGVSADKSKNIIFGFSGSGQYIIYDVATKTTYKKWTKSSIVNKFDYNLLTVRKVGQKYYCFINKQFVASFPFVYYGNKIGIHLNKNTTIKADYLNVNYLGSAPQQVVNSYNYAPEIVITEPSDTRGFKVVAVKSTRVAGKATDADGIYEVKINGISASLQSGGYFSADVPLAVGNNTIIVKATDTKMKTATKTFTVNRKADDVPNFNTNQKRVALIFGNSNYTGAASLGVNPINDATDIAATLRSLGFKVILKTNANLTTMNNAIREFGRQNRDADVALFYFAGHGMQIEKTNYLLPIGVNIRDKNDVSFECVSVNTVQNIMETSNAERLNLIVLDACRNNPFRSWSRGGETGLADMTPPSGTLIAFSTSPGSTASNGAGRNGLYTGELIKQLKVAQRIEDVFINTRVAVEKKSGGRQSPWELARLRGKFFLVR